MASSTDRISAWLIHRAALDGDAGMTNMKLQKLLGTSTLKPPSGDGFDWDSVQPADAELLSGVWRRYGKLSATQLRDSNHAEPPWAHTHVAGKKFTKLPDSLLADYFKIEAARHPLPQTTLFSDEPVLTGNQMRDRLLQEPTGNRMSRWTSRYEACERVAYPGRST